MKRVCGTCKHWFEGECRRYPPALRHVPSGDYQFPLTSAETWCGEHQGKPGRKANGDSK